jgi:hypothetical protein
MSVNLLAPPIQPQPSDQLSWNKKASKVKMISSGDVVFFSCLAALFIFVLGICFYKCVIECAITSSSSITSSEQFDGPPPPYTESMAANQPPTYAEYMQQMETPI